MDWMFLRWMFTVAAAGCGAWLGHAAGQAIDLPRVGMLAGVVAGASLGMALDALQARRLLQWLRDAPARDAPRQSGLWGELGHRMERSLRVRDRDLLDERRRIEQFLSAIEASPNGVALLDRNGQLQWCNSTAADQLGLDPVGDLRQPITNLVRAPEFVAHLQGGDSTDAVPFSLPGRPGTLSVIVRPYGDGQHLLLTQDITERQRTDEMRRDFVANVSHEIRTPLTVLAGYIETMSQVQLTETERRRALSVMAEQTNRMRSLVDDLLSLAQIEGSPRPPTDRWVDVTSLMQRVERDARSLSSGRHTLAFDFGPGGAIAGNEAELMGALANLVTNALRYTPAGGRVGVRWLRRGNGSCALEVADTGPGIAAEHLPRLGERFYRVDSGRSRETGGTGLGLAIAKHAVRRHGGELEVESELSKGSVFRLVFPPARLR